MADEVCQHRNTRETVEVQPGSKYTIITVHCADCGAYMGQYIGHA